MRIGRFDQVAKNMVSELFQAEHDANFLEAQTTSFSVKCNVSTAAMLTVLSELFSQSRFAFTGEILEDFTTDLFLNLPPDKQKEIALKADSITTELLAKQGVTGIEGVDITGEFKGSNHWTCMIATKQFIDSKPDVRFHLGDSVEVE